MLCRCCLLVALLTAAGAVSLSSVQVKRGEVLALTSATLIEGRDT
jgi:hypothetical protein